MNGGDYITRRQLSALMFVSLLSPIMRLLPKRAVELAGARAWLSPIAAAPVMAALVLMAAGFISQRRPREGLGELFQRLLGKWPGRIAAALYGLWMALYAGFVLRSGAERLLSTIYDDGDLTFFLLIILGVTVIAAQGRLRALARSAEVFFIILIVTLTLTLVFALPQAKMANLFPVTFSDTGRILQGAVPVMNVSSTWIYLLFLYGSIKAGPEDKKMSLSGLRWQGATLFIIILLMVTTIGAFGDALLLKLQYPFFVMIRDIRIANVIERAEAVVIAIWGITDFVFMSALLSSGAEAMRGALGVKKRRWLVYPCGALALAAAYLISRTAFELTYMSEQVVPFINLVFVFAGLPIILLIGALRKKLKKGEKRG